MKRLEKGHYGPPALGPAKVSPLARAAIVACLLAGGCAVTRSPVPDEDAELAVIPGLEHYRCFGDEAGEIVRERLAKSFELERQSLGEAPDAPLPDTQYLALSGGGQNGAFGAGVLCGWTASGQRPTFKIVTGISTGALIEKYVDERFLERVAQESRKGRLLILGTTNMDAERPMIWFMGGIAASGHPDALRLFRDVILASASIPGVFPPVMIEVEAGGKRYDEMHVDGGVCAQVFMYPAALDMRKLSTELRAERRRSIYVIRNGKTTPEKSVVERSLFSIAARSMSCLILNQGVGDLYRIYLGCQRDGIDFRYTAIPADFRHEKREEFDPAYMSALFDVGYRMAEQGDFWQKAPPGFDESGPGVEGSAVPASSPP